MAHVLTNIPLGSCVTVYANSAYRHGRVRSSATGAITILAHEAHYPIKVTVRPGANLVRDHFGNLSLGPMDSMGHLPGEESRLSRLAPGTPIDIIIKTPDDWYYPGSPRVIPDRHSTMVRVQEVRAASIPETDIYTNFVEPEPFKSGLCLGFKVTDSATLACNSPVVPGLDYCEPHALEHGLIAPPQNRCQWRDCTGTKYMDFPFCLPHCQEARLPVHYVNPQEIVGPTPVSQDPLPPVFDARKSDRSTPPARTRAPHKEGCMCGSCTKKRAKAERTRLLESPPSAEVIS